jgi:hypothetical protein
LVCRYVKNILKQGQSLGAIGEGGDTEWEILLSAEVESFLDRLYESDPASHQLVNQAILVLERSGPAEGRPLVDSIKASRIANMKSCGRRHPGVARSGSCWFSTRGGRRSCW